MGENLKEKYGISNLELQKGIDIVSKNLGKIPNQMVMIAIADLLATGDIKEEK